MHTSMMSVRAMDWHDTASGRAQSRNNPKRDHTPPSRPHLPALRVFTPPIHARSPNVAGLVHYTVWYYLNGLSAFAVIAHIPC